MRRACAPRTPAFLPAPAPSAPAGPPQVKLELAQLLAQYNTSDIELKTLETAIGQTQNRLFAAMDELNKGKARLTSLENIRASHANFYQGVKAVLQASDKLPGIIGAVADLVSLDRKSTRLN